MNTFFTFVVVLQVLSALAIIVLVLLQHGKGADMGAAFGSGSSGSLFGATGASNFLSKSTAVAVVVFFVSTLGLAKIGGRSESTKGGVMENIPAAVAPMTPSAAPTPTSTSTPADVGQANQIPK
jgi:preprotein translocase subunit SecG